MHAMFLWFYPFPLLSLVYISIPHYQPLTHSPTPAAISLWVTGLTNTGFVTWVTLHWRINSKWSKANVYLWLSQMNRKVPTTRTCFYSYWLQQFARGTLGWKRHHYQNVSPWIEAFNKLPVKSWVLFFPGCYDQEAICHFPVKSQDILITLLECLGRERGEIWE